MIRGDSVGVTGTAIVILLITAAVLIIPWSLRSERARKRALREWAAEHGWRCAAKSKAPWTARLPGANPRGLSTTLSALSDGRWVTVADYTDTAGESREDYIVVLVLLDQRYPPVTVLDRGPLSKLGRSLFGDKPTATGDEPFDIGFRISSPDPGSARRLVGPSLRAAHLAGAVPSWSLDGNGLLSWTRGRLEDPHDIPAHVASLLQVADLLDSDWT